MLEDAGSREKSLRSEQVTDTAVDYDEATLKRIKFKVDCRLCVVIAIMYTVCQIDRTNLANAYVLPPFPLFLHHIRDNWTY